MKKHIVAGMGEIGKPILDLLSHSAMAIGYDTNPKLVNKTKLEKYNDLKTSFLHVCIPFTKNFEKNIMSLYNKFKPEAVVIHSTVGPHTTEKLQTKLGVPVIYSATRGVHKRMLYDLKRYTKFFAIEPNAPNAKWASKEFASLMRKCKVKTKQMTNPVTLELAKVIVDTSYYGWLITYSQLSNMIAIKNKVNYDEMWSFADEIHKFLGNRPKMFPGFIGGHCVLPNLDLIKDETLYLIKEINKDYAKILKKRQVQRKKH
jgi:UDP-N-acetyl-D-mannosaminuronate dehydrogenase